MMQQKQEPAFRFPAQLIRDTNLSPSAKQLALGIFSLLGPDGVVCATQRRLAALSGLAVSTVNNHLPKLQGKYLNVTKQKARFDRSEGRPRAFASVITCAFPERDYVLIPYSILDKLRRRVIRCTDIPVLLYVRSQVNVNKGYAYPSLKKIVKETGLAMRCVCGALKALAAAGLLYIEKCLKVNGAFSCNSYFFLRGRAAAPAECSQVKSEEAPPQSQDGEYGKFQNNRDKSKITLGFTREERNYRDFIVCTSFLARDEKNGTRLAPPCKTVSSWLFQIVTRFGQSLKHALHVVNFLIAGL